MDVACYVCSVGVNTVMRVQVSKDKVEVCVKCKGVGGVGWGPPKAVIPFHMLLTIQCC